MGAKGYAEVVVELSIPAADRVFHYRIPEGLQGKLGVGDMVLVPFHHRQVTGYVLDLIEEPKVTQVKDIIQILFPGLLEARLIKLGLWLAAQYNCSLQDALRCVLPPGGGRVIRGRQERVVHLTVTREETNGLIVSLRGRAPKQAQILQFLFEAKEPPTVKELEHALKVSGKTIKALARKGLVRIEGRGLLPAPSRMVFVSPLPERLTPEQARACRAITCSLAGQGPKSFLLHGITASGKTEVYLQVIAEGLKRGKGAIVLVPEISLTPQMLARFRARFGRQVAVLHSRLSPGERYEEWWRIRRGEAPIVVGARSAVFAPVVSLGLIILDEEHENTYKQEESPRYNARQVAEFRARTEGAVLVLGSATPSVESYYKALMGQYRLLQLTRRVDGQQLPKIELVDMRQELEEGNRSIFSRRLQRALAINLERREQAILFLNRRGFATFVLCRQCGYVATCPNCDVSLTYHRESQRLQCHYCFHETELPRTCPACGSRYIRHFGLGTQRVEAEVQRFFPSARTLRMDMDTTRSKDAYGQLLETFARGKADILIGTQMIAKGLDFPGVTLVGVISADTSLNFPDFRAGERTFQLLTQVAGRAGRGKKPGRVIVQTYTPDHYSIQAACQHDYQGFYRQEIEFRRRLAYPPFSELVRIVASSTVEEKAAASLVQLTERLRGILPPGCQIYGPGPAPLARIRGKYRYQVVIKGVEQFPGPTTWLTLRREWKRLAGREGVNFSFDYAPISLL